MTIIHVSSLYSRLGYSKGIIEGRWSTSDQSPATRSDTCRRSSVLKIDLCWGYFSPTYAYRQRYTTYKHACGRFDPINFDLFVRTRPCWTGRKEGAEWTTAPQKVVIRNFAIAPSIRICYSLQIRAHRSKATELQRDFEGCKRYRYR